MTRARAANRVDAVYEHWQPLSDEEFAKCMTDFEEFCRQSIILDKNGSPITFTLNNAQKIVAKEILKALDPIMKKVPCPSIKVLIHKSRQMGITIPIIPGIKPMAKLSQLTVVPKTFHCDIPEPLAKEVVKCKTDEDAKQLGIEWTTQQCKDLYAHGVHNIHFYTVSAVDSVAEIVKRLVVRG